MNKLQTALKIALTNWITLITYYLGFVIWGFIARIVNFQNIEINDIGAHLLAIFIFPIAYIIPVAVIFILMVFILDIVLFSIKQKYIIQNLFFQLIIFYCIIFYDSSKDDDNGFTITFLLCYPIAQALRYKHIQKILGLSEKIPKWHYVLLLTPSIIALLLWSYKTLKEITYVFPKPNIVTINGVMYQNHQFNQDMNWTQANQYCENLSFGGYQDWRLPTQEELYGMMVAYPDKNATSAEDDPELIAWRKKNQDKQTTNYLWYKYYIRQEFVGNIKEEYFALWSSNIEDGDAYCVDFTNAYHENRLPLSHSAENVSCVRK